MSYRASHYATVAVGAPRVRRVHGKTIITATVVPDSPLFQSMWGMASLMSKRNRRRVEGPTTITGLLLESHLLCTGPLAFTMGDRGRFVVSWAPMRHTMQDCNNKIVTITTGMPPGSTHELPPVIFAGDQKIYVDPIYGHLPLRQQMTCAACLHAMPLTIGKRCARCIMLDAPF